MHINRKRLTYSLIASIVFKLKYYFPGSQHRSLKVPSDMEAYIPYIQDKFLFIIISVAIITFILYKILFTEQFIKLLQSAKSLFKN